MSLAAISDLSLLTFRHRYAPLPIKSSGIRRHWKQQLQQCFGSPMTNIGASHQEKNGLF